ncbi:MAG: alpha/beta hydrolase [Marinifilaceae bacterium]|jgi:carboxylesterase type B|nr:alpha/beta hydrolase [Marinifilaceae bacterium]
MKNIFKNYSLILLLLMLIISCTNNTNQEKAKYREVNNIPYYNNNNDQPEKTKLNLIIPENTTKPPVLIWIGQGAWAYVNRDVEMKICRRFAENGIFTISVGHRLSPALLKEPQIKQGIKHPEHIKDIAKAFKWVYENADKYNYSKQNIFVAGYSSGAHLAALLAMDSRYLNDLGLSNKMIRAIIPISGCYDIPKYKKVLIEENPKYEQIHINPVFGASLAEQVDASPNQYIDSLITPALFISDNETNVYHRFFDQDLREAKHDNVEFVYIYNKTHAELWHELGSKKPSKYRSLIVNYIQEKTIKQRE